MIMDNSTKILVGAAVTALFSLGAHSIGSAGASFVDRLENSAKNEISDAGLDNISLSFVRDPAITRDAVLSGDVPQEQRDKAISIVKNIAGVGNVRWADDATGADNSDTADADGITAVTVSEETADEAVVTKCQSDIDSIMQGKNINFRSGSFYVPPSSYALLDEIVATLKPCDGVTLEVQGHTDLTGNAAINQSMSEGRAAAVKDALVKRGLDADRIVAKGYGSTQPVENAKTSAANAKNRRTIFVIS